jgi:SpoVK/Ycf46/Vps4 family AAA+-type ATPase
MEHFQIVQALSRAAIANGTPAIRKQIERLRDALLNDGEARQAGALSSILNSADKSRELAPSRIERSKLQLSGEELTRNTALPVDRETAAPLAEITFPNASEPPLFSPAVSEAVGSIVDEWSNLEALGAVGIHPSRTCLIYGAPGTGKTRLALWIAGTLGLPVVLVRLDGLVSSFLGTTARNIGNLFAFANRYKCVLLLDEFDAIAKLRDDPQEVGEIKRVVNALLQNLDSRRDVGLTIGITNHPDLLDPAVWRRFEVQLEIPRPDFTIRKEIAASFMRPLTPPDSHLRLIAWFTDGATGAEIESLVRTYKKAAAIHEDDRRGLLDTLRQFATLNAARVHKERRQLLFGEAGALFRAMRDDPILNFSMTDIGDIAGKNKSTVSRQIGRETAQNDKEEVGNG